VSTKRRYFLRVNHPDGTETWEPVKRKRRGAIELTPGVAAVLAAVDDRLRESLLEPKAIETYTTDRALHRHLPGSDEALASYWGGPTFSWEGPRARFDLIYGTTEIWTGTDRDTDRWWNKSWHWIIPPVFDLIRDHPDDGDGKPATWWIWERSSGRWLCDRALTEQEARDGINWLLSQESGDIGGLRERRCRFCGHKEELEEIASCIGCERTGKDGKIERPTVADLKKRVEAKKIYKPTPGVKGGKS
jgi:hypothetical protein